MIKYKYDESKNPDGARLDGVPLRDLTADEFNKLKPHYQRAVKATAFYVEVKASKTAKAEDK